MLSVSGGGPARVPSPAPGSLRGLRELRVGPLQRGDQRELLPRQEVDQGPAPRRHVVDLPLKAHLLDDGHRVPAPGSPPPTTLNAAAFATAAKISRVPRENSSSSNTPAGPFRMIVRARSISFW